MLRIKRDTDYAIRCVFNLSRRENSFSQIDTLSKDEDIPRPFVAKIMHKLNKEGIVKSQRGKGGGYLLAIPPEQITLYDIIKIMEPMPLLNICLDDSSACKRTLTCPVHKACEEIEKNLRKDFEAYSFQTLIDIFEKQNSSI